MKTRDPDEIVPIDRLRELISYDPETGWLTRQGQSERAGGVRGIYRYLSIYGEDYLEHRVAFALMTGRWPIEVDHKNRVKTDNWWDNLRECEHTFNQTNIVRRQRSGYRGVYMRKDGGYFSKIAFRNTYIYLGQFDDPLAAHFAYYKKSVELFGEFAMPPNMSEFW